MRHITQGIINGVLTGVIMLLLHDDPIKGLIATLCVMGILFNTVNMLITERS